MHLIIIVQGTEKKALKLSRPSSSWAIDQNYILTVLIHGILKFQCHFEFLGQLASRRSTFVHYLKIINFFWKITYAKSKLSKELKNGIEFLVGQAVLNYGSTQ